MSAGFLGEELKKAFFFNPDIWNIVLEIIALVIIAILFKSKIGEYITPIAAIIYAIWLINNDPTKTSYYVWVIVLFSISIVFIALRRIIEKFKDIQ